MKEERKIQRVLFVRGLLVSIGIWQRSLPHNLTNKTYPIIKYKLRENDSTHGFCTKSSPSCYVITAFENPRKLYPKIRRSHQFRRLTNNQ